MYILISLRAGSQYVSSVQYYDLCKKKKNSCTVQNMAKVQNANQNNNLNQSVRQWHTVISKIQKRVKKICVTKKSDSKLFFQ